MAGENNPLKVGSSNKYSKQNVVNVIGGVSMAAVALGLVPADFATDATPQIIAFIGAGVALVNLVLRTFFNQGPIFDW